MAMVSEQTRKLLKRKAVLARDHTRKYLLTFLKWAAIAVAVGVTGGLVGTVFHHFLEMTSEARERMPYLIFLMPLAGLAIVFLYRICKMTKNNGTDRVIEAIRTDIDVPPIMAPLIFITTGLTHLTGGSAGREGAALQLGGSIGCTIGKLIHLDKKDMHIIIMCGMASAFSALFGTPMTAAVFSMEVISVGIIYYAGLVPCIISSIIAYKIGALWGTEPTAFILVDVPLSSIMTYVRIALLAVLCAGGSIVFCSVMRRSRILLKRQFPNSYVRAFIGGLMIIAMTILVGDQTYNGAGMQTIEQAISSEKIPGAAFLLKMLFTAITIHTGYKGGEIVPTFFIGATFGSAVSGLIGLPSGFGAAIGLVSMFCGVLNCPLASIMLAIELFGSGSMLMFSVAVGISYMLSGYFGLYGSQKIIYSKLTAEYVNTATSQKLK